MYELFPGERIVVESMNKRVTLTNRRICYSDKSWGRSYHQHITLDHISSCEYNYGSRVWLLVLAGLFIVSGLLAGINDNISTLCGTFLIALLCGVMYMITRRSRIAIGSSSTKMRINVIGLNEEEVLRFIYLIGKAQQEELAVRYQSI